MAILDRPREIARATPDDRLRSIDFVRTVSMLVVVFGHWLLALVWINSVGDAQFGDALEQSRIIQYVTWILQVMPLFFLAGGFSNARSFSASRAKGIPRRDWLVSRAQRLIGPTLPVIAFWSIIVFFVGRLADPGLLANGVKAAIVPMWFLAVYLIAVVAAPFTYVAWEKWGYKTIAVGVAAAVTVDVLRLQYDVPYVSYLNFVFVWLTVHQVGHAWTKQPSVRTGQIMAVSGLILLKLLTSFGPYTVAMVGLDVAGKVNNNAPPTICLLALTLFQGGLLAMATPRLERWLKRETPWSIVVLASAFSMSIYLWHMTAMVIVILASITIAQGLIQSIPLSATWWMTRPVWITILIMVTLPLVAFFRRFEQRSAMRIKRTPIALGIGIALFSLALAAMIDLGLANDAGATRIWIPAAAFVGAGLAGVFSFKKKLGINTEGEEQLEASN